MEKTNYTLSFGRYLKTERQQRGISLNQVADEIRVGLWLLTLIETEDHERLPDEVYVKGILRAYAKSIGVDPNDVIERYRHHRNAFLQSIKAETDLLNYGRRSLPRMVMALGVLLVVVCASLYIFYAFEGDTGTAPEKSIESQPDVKANTEVSIPEAGPKQVLTADNKLHLKIEVLSEVAINVQIDEQPYTKYRLLPNDEARLVASRRFNLLISDARGVRLSLNGKPLNVEGKSGESVNLVLSREDIVK